MAEVKHMTDAVLSNVNANAPGSARAVPKAGASSSSSSGSKQPSAAKKQLAINALQKKRKSDEDLMRAATKALFKNV